MAKTDKKRRFIRPRTFIFIACIIFLLVVGGLLGRGVWRSQILPAFASTLHKHQLEAAHKSSATVVNNALKPLGLDVGEDDNAICNLDIAIQWRTSINCSTDSYGTSKPLSSMPAETDPSIQQIITTMSKEGWSGGVDKSGMLSLYFHKVVNGFDCNVQLINDVYQNTVKGRLFCSQNYNYLGDPYNHL